MVYDRTINVESLVNQCAWLCISEQTAWCLYVHLALSCFQWRCESTQPDVTSTLLVDCINASVTIL